MSKLQCNLCGNNKFIDFNKRKSVMCSKCYSLERTRLIWMEIENFVSKGMRILHLAPERGLALKLSEAVGPETYEPCDLDPYLYPHIPNIQKIDLSRDLEIIPDDSYDLVLHSHVLEHVRCNIAYPLYHFHRILKKNGLHVFTVPFQQGFWEENLDPNISIDEKIRRFGQYDHCRQFGTNDWQNSIGKILNIGKYEKYCATSKFTSTELDLHNIPQSNWFGLTAATPIQLQKDDYKLALFSTKKTFWNSSLTTWFHKK